MTTEPTRPEDELEQLKRRKERAELEAQLAALSAPWWRKGSLVTAVAAILAAVLPVTKAVEEHYRHKREVALDESQHQHAIRIAYLERFEMPGSRLRTLRFLMATSTDERLLAWARAEEVRVLNELAGIDDELAAVSELIGRTTDPQRLAELKTELARLRLERDQASLRPRTLGAERGAVAPGAVAPGAGSAGAPGGGSAGSGAGAGSGQRLR